MFRSWLHKFRHSLGPPYSTATLLAKFRGLQQTPYADDAPSLSHGASRR